MLDLIIGRRELGKTTLAVSLSRHFSTRVIFDPRHMIDVTSDILNGDNVGELLYQMLDDRAEIVVRPSFDTEQVFADTCAEIYRWLKNNPTEPFCLLLDEIRFIKELEDNPHFEYIIRCTPRSRVTVVMTCHGIIDIPTDLRRIADYLILFRLTMAADIDRVREKCGDQVADEVQELKPYEYIVWNDANATWRKYTDRTLWFVPLERRIAV